VLSWGLRSSGLLSRFLVMAFSLIEACVRHLTPEA
jgi:hypothetical protein